MPMQTAKLYIDGKRHVCWPAESNQHHLLLRLGPDVNEADPKTTIDHDPFELPRKLVRVAAILTVVLTLAVVIPLGMGVRWFVYRIPFEAVILVDGLIFGLCFGFFWGRWDVLRQFRPEDLPGWWRLKSGDLTAFLRYAAYLLILAPFAIVILPVKSWTRARNDGDGVASSASHAIAGAIFGLMISLAAWLVVLTPIEVLLGK